MESPPPPTALKSALKASVVTEPPTSTPKLDAKAESKKPANNRTTWRSRDRVKTSAAVLAVCVHLGIDPPDIVRPQPGASMLAGVPLPAGTKSPSEHKAIAESIGQQLQASFEYWQPRCHYRTVVDPPVDELKRACLAARKAARDERVLFYYNGWGVPKPTCNGELWFFNANYTQYLPVSVADLDSWLGPGPIVIVLECADAGVILQAWRKLRDAASVSASLESVASTRRKSTPSFYGFAAVDAGPTPSVPGMSGDLFTCAMVNPLQSALQHAQVGLLPGRLGDRSTLLGQMHWIFTALTDTLGWQLFTTQSNMPAFKQLYRQDVLVASLFRNFLLAQLVTKCHGIKSVSVPEVAWRENDLRSRWDCLVDRYSQYAAQGIVQVQEGEDDFFGDHLEAFERHILLWPACNQTWVGGSIPSSPRKSGSSSSGGRVGLYYPYLPIILQMLLSQQHRVRSLEALVRFVDLDFETTPMDEETEDDHVNRNIRQILDVGIYPYLLKLLHAGDRDAREALAKLWLRLLAYDGSTADDLKGSSTSSSFPPWTFFVPKLPEDADEVHTLLACLYLVGRRLGPGKLFSVMSEEEMLPADVQTASPVFSSLLLGKPIEGNFEGDMLLVKMHLECSLTDNERASLLGHPDESIRVFYVHWLGKDIGKKTAMHQAKIALEEVFKNDPSQRVRDAAESHLLERTDDRDDDSGESKVGELSRRVAQAAIGGDADIPAHLLRKMMVTARPMRTPAGIIGGGPRALPTRLYEHFVYPVASVQDVAFDAAIPGLLYLLASDGTLAAYDYDDHHYAADPVVFEGFLVDNALGIKAVRPRGDAKAGFSVQTFSGRHYDYAYGAALPASLISCPAKLQPVKVRSWRPIPDAKEEAKSEEKAVPWRRICPVDGVVAELLAAEKKSDGYRVVLTGESSGRTLLDLPALDSKRTKKGHEEDNNFRHRPSASMSGGNLSLMETLRHGLKTITHFGGGGGSEENASIRSEPTSPVHILAPSATQVDGCLAWHPQGTHLAVALPTRHAETLVFVYSDDSM